MSLATIARPNQRCLMCEPGSWGDLTHCWYQADRPRNLHPSRWRSAAATWPFL